MEGDMDVIKIKIIYFFYTQEFYSQILWESSGACTYIKIYGKIAHVIEASKPIIIGLPLDKIFSIIYY